MAAGQVRVRRERELGFDGARGVAPLRRKRPALDRVPLERDASGEKGASENEKDGNDPQRSRREHADRTAAHGRAAATG